MMGLIFKIDPFELMSRKANFLSQHLNSASSKDSKNIKITRCSTFTNPMLRSHNLLAGMTEASRDLDTALDTADKPRHVSATRRKSKMALTL